MSEFVGMTVNERLWHAELMKQFDSAILARQEATAIEILVRVEIPEMQAKEIIQAIFSNPVKYGYT